MDYINEAFFYDKDFVKDEEVAIAGDCMQQLIAIMMKKAYGGQYNPYAIYADNFSFSVAVDEDGYIIRSAIKSNETSVLRKTRKKNKVTVWKDYEGARAAITKALKEYGYAILRTVDAYLPFSIYYNPENYSMSDFAENGHVIMILDEDEDNYVFIDQMTELNMDMYRHIPERKDIGIWPKSEFKKPLSEYARVTTVDFCPEQIKQSEAVVDKIIAESVDYYYNNYATREQKGNMTVSGGRSGLIKLLDMFSEGKIELQRSVFNTGINAYSNMKLGQELMNGITGIQNRRLVLKGLIDYDSENKYALLTEPVEACIEVWGKLKNNIMKDYYRKSRFLNVRNEEYFRKAVDCEDRLFEAMSSL